MIRTRLKRASLLVLPALIALAPIHLYASDLFQSDGQGNWSAEIRFKDTKEVIKEFESLSGIVFSGVDTLKEKQISLSFDNLKTESAIRRLLPSYNFIIQYKNDNIDQILLISDSVDTKIAANALPGASPIFNNPIPSVALPELPQPDESQQKSDKVNKMVGASPDFYSPLPTVALQELPQSDPSQQKSDDVNTFKAVRNAPPPGSEKGLTPVMLPEIQQNSPRLPIN